MEIELRELFPIKPPLKLDLYEHKPLYNDEYLKEIESWMLYLEFLNELKQYIQVKFYFADQKGVHPFCMSEAKTPDNVKIMLPRGDKFNFNNLLDIKNYTLTDFSTWLTQYYVKFKNHNTEMKKVISIDDKIYKEFFNKKLDF